MTDHQLYLVTALIGQILPMIIDAVNRYIPNSKLRFLVSLVICIILGLIYNLGQLSFENTDAILTSSLILWVSSQAAYKTFYEGSKTQASIRFNSKLLP